MLALIKRELKLYFITPVAYIFTAIFILTSMSLTFYFGSFFSSGVKSGSLEIMFFNIPIVPLEGKTSPIKSKILGAFSFSNNPILVSFSFFTYKLLYSLVASKDGQALFANSLCE